MRIKKGTHPVTSTRKHFFPRFDENRWLAYVLLFLFFSRALIVADSNYDWLIAFSAHIVSCFIGYPWASLTNQNAFVVKKEFFFTFYLFLHLFILRFYFEEWTIHKRHMNFLVTSKVATKEGLKMACKVSLCKIYSSVSSDSWVSSAHR